MALFSLRPVWGLWMQWRLRRVGLTPVPASVTHCLNDLAQRLGLRRTVSVAQSVRIGVPMAVGYLRPLILLPGCVITGLTAAQLEALIAHELAHIRRHDWLVNAFQLLVETVFFYHPAVWWLSRQIRQERENCCDDLAVLLVGDRGTVGRMLLALEELRERTPGLALAATGGNLLSRVRRVVAKGRQPEPTGREWLPAGVLLLLAGLGGAAWAMSAGTAEKKSPTSPIPAVTGKNNAASTSDVRRIAGRVVDSEGRPMQGARLWWVVLDHYPDEGQFTIEGTSDAQGRFALEAPAAWKPPQQGRLPADMLWVLAPGKDLKVVRATDGLVVAGTDSQFVISLAPATVIEYEVRNQFAHPVGGAVVEPWHFQTPRFIEYLPTQLRGLLKRTTDQAGRVQLISLPHEDLYQVQIRATGLGTQKQQLDGPYDSSRDGKITLRPAGRVEGRLIAEDPRWARSVKLFVRTEQRPWAPPDGSKRRVLRATEGEILVQTDEQGHFQIPEIAPGRASIKVVDLSDKSPVAPRLPTSSIVFAGETLQLDIPMEKLVRVKGTIRTDDTQAPVGGAEIFVQYGLWVQGDHVISDSQGHYHARVLPGSVHTQVISMPRQIGEHYQELGDSADNPVQVGAGMDGFELPPIVLAATKTLPGTLIDQGGRPITGASVSGLRGRRRYGFARTNERGEFSLQLPKQLAMDRYEVGLPRRRQNRPKPTVIKYEPFTLQVDLTEDVKKSGQQNSKTHASQADKREKTVESKPAAAANQALPPAGPPAATLSVRATPSVGGTALIGAKLTGTVRDSDAKPVAGAMVMIWTASVKHGYSTYCPSCYADCFKRAVTNAEGAFAISRVDPGLRFRLLIIREGYAPRFAAQVDPFDGPAGITLTRRRPVDDPHRVLHGHVVGPRGEPLAGALVEAESVWYQEAGGHSTRTWGAPKWVDPLAVTNDQGDFEIASVKAASSMTVTVGTRGMAPRRFPALDLGTVRHTLALNRGASVRGRLLSHGLPVGGAEMGLVLRDREIDRFYVEVRVGTEPDGSFLFANVPVPGRWYVYAKMDSVHSRGATDAVECVTEREDEAIDLGDVALQPGHRLRGRVVLTDGKPVPDGMRIHLSAKRAWDDQIHELPPDGRFEFVGLPTDDFSINPAVKGYQPSPENPNRNLGIDGLIDRDVDNFVILLEPGKDRMNRIGEDFKGKVLRSAPTP